MVYISTNRSAVIWLVGTSRKRTDAIAHSDAGFKARADEQEG